jgi:hypothetical protein
MVFRLAEASPTPVVSKKAAQTYFSDLEDVYVFSGKKNGARVHIIYTY